MYNNRIVKMATGRGLPGTRVQADGQADGPNRAIIALFIVFIVFICKMKIL